MSWVVWFEYLAVVVSAIYGVLLASRYGMDVVGVFTVTAVVSFGGGTLRDLFLDRQPLFWIGKPHYLMIVFVISIAASLVLRFVKRVRGLLLLPDAISMGLFSMVGCSIALSEGTGRFIAAILGTVAGTFGSVLGDIVCNEVPTLFRPAPLCATCAFLGVWAYIGLREFAPDLGEPYFTIFGSSVVVVLRLASVKWSWQLPAIRESRLQP